jgi:hypothetical protein
MTAAGVPHEASTSINTFFKQSRQVSGAAENATFNPHLLQPQSSKCHAVPSYLAARNYCLS